MQPRPAIVLTDCRTGSTFLCGCLSNHPRIYWDRGEPGTRGKSNYWSKLVPDRPTRLKLIFSQQWYEVSGCKLMIRHVTPDIFDFLHKRWKRLKVIYLVREDVVDQALSWEVNVRTSYAHSWEGHEPKLQKVDLHVKGIKKRLKQIELGRRQAEDILARLGADVYTTSYERITGGKDSSIIPPEEAKSIRKFLGVPYWSLYTSQKKLNTRPWEAAVRNWEEISGFIRDCRRAN